MKKALVVEINDNNMIVLDNKGRFKKIKNKLNLKVGDEYERNEGLAMKKGIVFAMTCVLLAGVGGYGYSYAAPKDYLTLDINPSVKLTTNRYDKVIKAEALNSDGETISKELKIKNKNVKEAIKLLVESAVDNGYIAKDDENAVMLASTSDEILDEAENGVDEGLKEEEIENTEIIKENINKERFDEAERLGISPGKVNLIQKLQAVLPEANLDDYANSSVKDIMKKIKEQRVEAKEESKIENSKTETEENQNLEETKESINSNDNGNTNKENQKNNENSSNKDNNVNLEKNEEKTNNAANKDNIKENNEKTNNSNKSEVNKTENNKENLNKTKNKNSSKNNN
jgi:hypothetical protein